MRIAYASTFDSRDVHNWSGTPYYMSKGLIDQGLVMDYIGPLKRKLPPFFKAKQVLNKYLTAQRESPRFNIFAAKYYSQQAEQLIKKLPVDAIISPLINPIAYLNCDQPIILWTDALYAGLVGFYPPFSTHSANTIREGNTITAQCLNRCALTVFSSDWAANTALQYYGVNKEKIKVIPFGANLEIYPSIAEIRTMIKTRKRDTIKLLFLAKSWERKGGDIVLSVARALHEAGESVQLTIVGYEPPGLNPRPPYVNCTGFISKHTPHGKMQLNRLIAETHFLFVPSRAEAYGIVFCEANAFAVPCLTTYVGGIGTIVKDNINGMTFALDASITTYCNYIMNLMHDYSQYEALALTSYNEFTLRLNWQSAAAEMKRLITQMIS